MKTETELQKEIRSLRARLGAATKEIKRSKSGTKYAVYTDSEGVVLEERTKEGKKTNGSLMTAGAAEFLGVALIRMATASVIRRERMEAEK